MNHDKKGFSLVELIIVLSIVIVVAGISIPVYNNLRPRYRLNGAARQVTSDMMWARMQAVSQNNEFKVFFLDDHKYEILDDNNNNGSIDSGESTITKNIQDEYYDVVFSSTANPIFHPRGIASPGATITLNLLNTDNMKIGTRTVKISLAGRIKIDEETSNTNGNGNGNS